MNRSVFMCATIPAEKYVKSKTDPVSVASPLSAWGISFLRQEQVRRYLKNSETVASSGRFLTQETQTNISESMQDTV